MLFGSLSTAFRAHVDNIKFAYLLQNGLEKVLNGRWREQLSKKISDWIGMQDWYMPGSTYCEAME
jgi:hypothetical protein